MSAPVVVLDASVGVKWFLEQEGWEDDRELALRHCREELRVVVDDLFMYEVVSALTNRRGPEFGRLAWSRLSGLELSVIRIGDDLVEAAIAQRELLGANMYDCFSAGLAAMLDVPLYSSDRCAHGAYPNVRLIG